MSKYLRRFKKVIVALSMSAIALAAAYFAACEYAIANMISIAPEVPRANIAALRNRQELP
jgi:hypothetical protein